ncbi:MAG: hypothetical protein ACI80V_003087 [Rhodothermales bacterium]|jgi:hypothetical protein
MVDELGRTVAVLADRLFPAGNHTVSFDGDRLPAGMYLVRYQANGLARTKPVILVC